MRQACSRFHRRPAKRLAGKTEVHRARRPFIRVEDDGCPIDIDVDDLNTTDHRTQTIDHGRRRNGSVEIAHPVV